MADSTRALRYADHEEHFRSHYREHFDEGESHVYRDYEPAYRSGFRYGTSDDYAGRSFADLEPEMHRGYEQEHGKGTWQKVKDAARHAFEHGRSRHTDEKTRPKSPSGSSETASGGPGSAMREGGFDAHRANYRRHHKETYSEGERDFRDRIPAYRHGHRFGRSEEHRGRDYEALEPDMRRSYEERHGTGTWAKVKDAVRHAFRRSRSSS